MLGHRFCCYAHDCNIDVKSEAAGQPAMAAITRYMEQKLQLRVNRDMRAVAWPWRRKLGAAASHGTSRPVLKIADSSLKRLKDRVRGIVVGNASRNFDKTDMALNPVLRGQASEHGPLPELPATLLDQLAKGPMSAAELQPIFLSFRKAVIERTMNAEMNHCLGYQPGQAKPEGAGQRTQWCVRRKAVRTDPALNASTYRRDVLGLWIEQTEGAQFWLKVSMI